MTLAKLLAGWVGIDSMVHSAIATHSPDGTAQHFKPEISTLLHPAAWHMQDIADV